MEKNYRVLETGSKGSKFSIHCKNLAVKYRGGTEENRKLAELHHQMARQGK